MVRVGANMNPLPHHPDFVAVGARVHPAIPGPEARTPHAIGADSETQERQPGSASEGGRDPISLGYDIGLCSSPASLGTDGCA